MKLSGHMGLRACQNGRAVVKGMRLAGTVLSEDSTGSRNPRSEPGEVLSTYQDVRASTVMLRGDVLRTMQPRWSATFSSPTRAGQMAVACATSL